MSALRAPLAYRRRFALLAGLAALAELCTIGAPLLAYGRLHPLDVYQQGLLVRAAPAIVIGAQ